MAKGPRKWVKVFCYETLHGSISYQLSEEEQAVWIKLLCFAGLCGNDGIIADHDLRPFPEKHIIQEIKTTPEIYQATMKKCKAEGRITENGQGILVITNWSKYQSEYDRQKQYKKGSHITADPAERQKILNAAAERHMGAWEAAHPGQIHPQRRAANIEQEGEE
jgi:hypothetical protein